MGLDVAELAVGERGDATFHAASLDRLVAADPQAPAFPAFFEGTIDGVTGGRRPLVAIAVNGTIAAVTRSYRSYGLLWFGALLRSRAFTGGGDSVRPFLVDDVRERAVVPLPRARDGAATSW